MIDINELRQALGAVQPEEVEELLDRLEAAEEAWKISDQTVYDLTEKVIPNIREKLEAAEKERDAAELMSLALRAKIEQMERQEPVALVKWQPIETAPRNQAFLAVLNCAGEQTICTMRWPVAEAKNSRPDSKTFHVERVTHWMPLPDLPGAKPAPSFADAYQGAMEEVAIWKKRALEAEELNRKFIAEINGPTYMGEPAQPAPSINEGVRKVTLDFRWESEAQHHIPTIEIEFDPVSPGSPNDAKGWQDRDRLAAMLAPGPKP